MDWLMARYEPLEIEYKVAATFALGMLISNYRFELHNPEHNMQIIMALDDMHIKPEQVPDIPALVFMLPSFTTAQTEPHVTAVVEQLSSTYFVVMRDRLDLLTCSTFALGWSMCNCYNPDLLDQMSESIIKKNNEGVFFESGDESEIVNLLSGMSNLGYRNEEVYQILHDHLVGPNFAATGEIEGQYDFFTLFNIISSFGRTFP